MGKINYKSEEEFMNTINSSTSAHRATFWGRGANSFLSVDKKFAFTLAEILITLGIIGVVAAMTIPNLIVAKEQRVTLTRLKKTYSDLAQAIRLAEADYGAGFSMCDFDKCENEREKSKAMFDKYIRPYIKVAKEYSDAECNNLYTIYTKSGLDYHPDKTGCYQLMNGTAIAFSLAISDYYEVQTYSTGFAVFPNPKKQRKLVGQDAFHFNYIDEGNGYYVGTAVRQRGNLTRAELISACSAAENKIQIVIGGQKMPVTSACTELIIRDGWKFAKDYPIKF